MSSINRAPSDQQHPVFDLEPSKIEKLNVLKQMRLLSSQGHTDRVNDLLTDARVGRFLFTASNDHTAKRWNIQTGQVLNHYKHPHAVNALALLPWKAGLVTGCEDGLLRMFDISSGELKANCAYDKYLFTAIICLAISPESDHTYVAGRDNRVKCCDLEGGKILHTLGEHGGRITAMTLSLDCTLLFTASLDHTVKKWSLVVPSHVVPPCVATFRHQYAVHYAKIGASLEHLYTCSGNQICVWHVTKKSIRGFRSSAPISSFVAHADVVTWFDLSSNGRTILTSSRDGTVKEWDLRTQMCTHLVTILSTDATCVAYGFKKSFFCANDAGLVIRAQGAGDGTVEDGKILLTESCRAQYENIPRYRIGSEIIALIVQFIQLLSFAFASDFLWGEPMEWAQQAVSPIQVSATELSKLIRSNRTVVVILMNSIIGWALLASLIFVFDVYACIYNARIRRQASSQEQAKREAAVKLAEGFFDKDPELFRESISASASNTPSSGSICTKFLHVLSEALWLYFWLNVTILAIPIIGFLSFAIVHSHLSYERILGGITLPLFALMCVLLRSTNGSISQLVQMRRRMKKKRLLWFLDIRALVDRTTLGPMTTRYWQLNLVSTLVAISFAVANSVILRTTFEARVLLASLNLAMSTLLLAGYLMFSRYTSGQANALITALQWFQTWNMLLALVTSIINDRSNFIVGMVWYGGVVVIFFSGLLYGCCHSWIKQTKSGESKNILDAAPPIEHEHKSFIDDNFLRKQRSRLRNVDAML